MRFNLRRRFLFWLKIIATSSVFSSLLAFSLNYFLIEKIRLQQVEVEIKKALAEITQAKLETTLRKTKAEYDAQLQPLIIQQHEISNKLKDIEAQYAEQQHEITNKLNSIELDIKESDKNIAEITSEYKLSREKSAVLKEDAESAGVAASLIQDLIPSVSSDTWKYEVISEDDNIIFLIYIKVNNNGKYSVTARDSVHIYDQSNGKEITAFFWRSDGSFHVSPGVQTKRVYRIVMAPDFYQMLSVTKKRIKVAVNFALNTNNDTVDMFAKKLSSYITKDRVKARASMNRTAWITALCWTGEERTFFCNTD